MDLLQSQIQESCKLALPEGLKDLMSDISREVLRHQPQNIYQFIADYLSALMVARSNLAVAFNLCDTVCTSACNPELEDELRYIGVNDEDGAAAMKIIEEFFNKREVNEQSLMIQIVKKTNIDGSQLPQIQEAIRNAFKRNMINNTTFYESSSESDLDEVACAAKHTLNLYRKTKHSHEKYSQAAQRVQAAYRAYGVRRSLPKAEKGSQEEKTQSKNIRFSADVNSPSGKATQSVPHKACLPSESSTSLAGSYLNLPRFIPYSVHGPVVLEKDEELEKESNTVNYTDEEYAYSGEKKISFQVSPMEMIEDTAVLADDESETAIEEMVYEVEEYVEKEESDHFEHQYNDEEETSEH